MNATEKMCFHRFSGSDVLDPDLRSTLKAGPDEAMGISNRDLRMISGSGGPCKQNINNQEMI